MLKIDDRIIPHIEAAMGFELYESQKRYLKEEVSLPSGVRRIGNTTAFCIRLALSEGVPLDMRKPEKFSDGYMIRGASYHDILSYSKYHFRSEFLDIRSKLKDHGFPVRDISQE